MKQSVKIIAITVILLVTAVSLYGCSSNTKQKNDTDELSIMTTLFPYYDFARAIVGDVENVNVEMIVTPGQDSHSFEPTPQDIIKIGKADLFLYNGGSIEIWVESVLDSMDDKNQPRLRMMDYVDVLEEETVEGMDLSGEEEEEEGEVEYDEHIWTSPKNSITLVNKICDELCSIDSENKDEYRRNADAYIEKIEKLDNDIRTVVNSADKKEFVFADRFPLQYFAKEYGLTYYAAFPGCGSDMEPSAKTIAFLSDKIKEDKINAVFYLELSSKAVANTICEDTGCQALQYNSCHNVTNSQFESGVTYVQLMEENLANLKIALK